MDACIFLVRSWQLTNVQSIPCYSLKWPHPHFHVPLPPWKTDNSKKKKKKPRLSVNPTALNNHSDPFPQFTLSTCKHYHHWDLKINYLHPCRLMISVIFLMFYIHADWSALFLTFILEKRSQRDKLKDTYGMGVIVKTVRGMKRTSFQRTLDESNRSIDQTHCETTQRRNICNMTLKKNSITALAQTISQHVGSSLDQWCGVLNASVNRLTPRSQATAESSIVCLLQQLTLWHGEVMLTSPSALLKTIQWLIWLFSTHSLCQANNN